jgi:hypothetical protein
VPGVMFAMSSAQRAPSVLGWPALPKNHHVVAQQGCGVNHWSSPVQIYTGKNNRPIDKTGHVRFKSVE